MADSCEAVGKFYESMGGFRGPAARGVMPAILRSYGLGWYEAEIPFHEGQYTQPHGLDGVTRTPYMNKRLCLACLDQNNLEMVQCRRRRIGIIRSFQPCFISFETSVPGNGVFLKCCPPT